MKGQEIEQLACDFLQSQGLVLIEKNYRCRQGEIDLIMRQNNTLVFVEVRYRKNQLFGGARESITQHKQNRLQTTALHYMQRHQINDNARFDVIAITGAENRDNIEWIQNAF
ncbi:MAG: YraN family protein [Gammaproteobacteria bacterium]|nr:MAG: YraN family protein [Gammaproteobacteria bacterium]